ncbi:MAG: porin [Candidatus Krumholzibacteria bacterium]|nr:porin [Candidatus Krumholzibacteria bacterium]
MFNSKVITTLMVLLIVLTAGVASAGDMDWSFYGKFHSSINMLSNGENSQLGLSSNTSRYGFKGGKVLNDDVTFVWQVEQAVNIAQGSFSTTLRNTYVGFKNAKMGEVRMGRHDTPHKTLGRKTTFFFDTVGDNRQMTFGTDSRLSDILAWVSPDWSGFALFLAYQFDQDGNKLNPNVAADAKFYAETLFSGMATYAKNEFFVGASMIMFGEGYEATGPTDARGDAPTVFRLAGKYNAEKFGIAASYLTIGAQDWDPTLATPAFVDMTLSTIGFEGMFHASEKYDIKAGYYMSDPNTDRDDDDFGMITFGVDRNFGKSTQLYVQYAMMSYGDAADPSDSPMGGSGSGFATGTSWSGYDSTDYTATPVVPNYESPYGLSFGVAHKW